MSLRQVLSAVGSVSHPDQRLHVAAHEGGRTRRLATCGCVCKCNLPSCVVTVGGPRIRHTRRLSGLATSSHTRTLCHSPQAHAHHTWSGCTGLVDRWLLLVRAGEALEWCVWWSGAQSAMCTMQCSSATSQTRCHALVAHRPTAAYDRGGRLHMLHARGGGLHMRVPRASCLRCLLASAGAPGLPSASASALVPLCPLCERYRLHAGRCGMATPQTQRRLRRPQDSVLTGKCCSLGVRTCIYSRSYRCIHICIHTHAALHVARVAGLCHLSHL